MCKIILYTLSRIPILLLINKAVKREIYHKTPTIVVDTYRLSRSIGERSIYFFQTVIIVWNATQSRDLSADNICRKFSDWQFQWRIQRDHGVITSHPSEIKYVRKPTRARTMSFFQFDYWFIINNIVACCSHDYTTNATTAPIDRKPEITN